MGEPSEVPDVVQIAIDAIGSGDAEAVNIRSPYRERRELLREATKSFDSVYVSGGSGPCIGDLTPDALQLYDDGRPSWEPHAESYVELATGLRWHPVEFVRDFSHGRVFPFSYSEFLEWFDTIAHTTPWPKI